MSIDAALVSWVCPTRGDIDMAPILDSLPAEFERVVYDGSRSENFGVFGRYIGGLQASRRVLVTQDDDCLCRNWDALLDAYEPGLLVGNMRNDPARLNYYRGTTLLGWGAIYDAHLPWLAFARYAMHHPVDRDFMFGLGAETAFPMLTPSKQILVDHIDWLHQNGSAVFGWSNRMSNADGFYDRHAEAMGRAREVLRDMPKVAA